MNTTPQKRQLLQPARDGEAEVGERVSVLDLETSAVRDYRLAAGDTPRRPRSSQADRCSDSKPSRSTDDSSSAHRQLDREHLETKPAARGIDVCDLAVTQADQRLPER